MLQETENVIIQIDNDVKDAYITEKWWQSSDNQKKDTSLYKRIENGDIGFFSRIFYRITFTLTTPIRKRLIDQENNEYKSFKLEMLYKLINIGHDVYFQRVIMDAIYSNNVDSLRNIESDAIDNLYGVHKASAIKEALTSEVNLNMIVKIFEETPGNEIRTERFDELRDQDPTLNWYSPDLESSHNIMTRIDRFVESVNKLIRWSFVSDPGNVKTDLIQFIGEFRQLDVIEEKVKEKNTKCANIVNYDQSISIINTVSGTPFTGRKTAAPTWYDLTKSVVKTPRFENKKSEQYKGASYVQGGPLMNTFIASNIPSHDKCGQFYKMVLSEKSQYIVLLSRIESVSEGEINESPYQHCYWPRLQGTEKYYGDIIVKNINVDCLADPVFNITTLEIKQVSSPDEPHIVELWHYDWSDFLDINWPTRILRRARLSPSPTIVQCADGIGRSGSLILIECALMQLLRGPSMSNPVFTAATFLRLQRKRAVKHYMHYLYVYRVLINFIEPYISSGKHRVVLGLTKMNIGYVKKFNKLALYFSKRNFV
ncbi:Protein-tyrosine phosphatase, receptor/non-receptor type domain and Protein-tyrosine/Dual specificity phosphatase domain and Protein-tyrosine phosphatase, catalytic domain-containing protein [Strongyloides ratti]|uniref:Protein-tyrosine phosphatase, receptor/non-receptor type domain and Protein-tyrosine/Dual specificity phosphatase domain and Protein-tyrosine phosphatase, catalytic domain-containing protein n=1 Tax=Strongyloides ratti TaxID=34506 RepID=A0A090L693_STRRB|nr:Protein-tyrosine phosphatase, receptor/non-receptor type domain and Protein-tyrosine/Dual specificity phosphatase domain and Protein-tyrosine phosphatase, catalytic domain-containing protein [Strongyloides ratti]CEF63638.1 Protein-tyrosine phosphatase, receptor/non-receptor type domain and Protein-tyrosine/Dual specificity phosphatase domain and Protein-tyrosine phosphatase, catalytic domain-containing protein [Strongyloides ratti]